MLLATFVNHQQVWGKGKREGGRGCSRQLQDTHPQMKLQRRHGLAVAVRNAHCGCWGG
jgi:hypothetical protein